MKSTNNMAKKKYTEKDLVKFGEYLLSEERENRIRQTVKEHPNSLPYKESKRNVYDADVANWKESQSCKCPIILVDLTKCNG